MKIATIKSQEGREMLLEKLDLAIDFESYLKSEGNILDDVKNVIKSSDLYLKILIIDNGDLINESK